MKHAQTRENGNTQHQKQWRKHLLMILSWMTLTEPLLTRNESTANDELNELETCESNKTHKSTKTRKTGAMEGNPLESKLVSLEEIGTGDVAWAAYWHCIRQSRTIY
jgi:hypothetical protein